MLRTIVHTTLGAIAHPTAPSTQNRRTTGDARVAVPAGRGPGTPRAATDGIAAGRATIITQVMAPTAIPMLAPWGESPELIGLAEVSTEPFPPEWWRRPRTAPPPPSPFMAATRPTRAIAVADHTTTIKVIARPLESAPTFATPTPTLIPAATARAEIADAVAPALDRSERRRRRGRFARLCLVVAGALISFIVVDAASGRAHR